jgi:hypothetical protein
VEIPCEHAGFLDLFRTREYAQESLDHFDVYLVLYGFKMESLASPLLFSIIFIFLASNTYMWVQWTSIGASRLKKHSFNFW